MRLYHGSNTAFKEIDLTVCRPNKDFGCGFYLSPDRFAAMFVMANRRPDMLSADHNRDNRYGVVVGPVANDDLALLFRQFSRGLVTVEMLVREMRYKQLTVQYSFHTPAAIAALEFVGVDDVR